MENNRNQMLSLVLAAVAAAMGIAVFVLGVVDAHVPMPTQISLLAIGLFALGLRALIGSGEQAPQGTPPDKGDDTPKE